MKTLCETLNIKSYSEKSCAKLSLRADTAFEFYKAVTERPELMPAHSGHTLWSKEWQSFRGSSFDSLCDNMRSPNMELFNKAKKDVSGKLASLSREIMLALPKRRRVMSEYDGELDLDRRYDLKPFNSTLRQNSATMKKSLTINCDFSIHAGISAEAINRYGALCWAFVEALEAASITCEVNIVNTTNVKNYLYKSDKATGKCSGKEPKTFFQSINIKRAGEYQNLQSMAKYFDVGYYRRVIFAVMQLTADLNGYYISDSLGHPIPPDSSVEYDKGIITLSARASVYDLNLDGLRDALS